MPVTHLSTSAGTTSAGATSVSFAHNTTGSVQKPYLLVTAGTNTLTYPTSVTFNGEALTQLDTDGDSTLGAALWGGFVSRANANVVVTYGSSVPITACSDAFDYVAASGTIADSFSRISTSTNIWYGGSGSGFGTDADDLVAVSSIAQETTYTDGGSVTTSGEIESGAASHGAVWGRQSAASAPSGTVWSMGGSLEFVLFAVRLNFGTGPAEGGTSNIMLLGVG